LCEQSAQPSQWLNIAASIDLTATDRETLKGIETFERMPSGYQDITATR
jgi:hypothetical protein